MATNHKISGGLFLEGVRRTNRVGMPDATALYITFLHLRTPSHAKFLLSLYGDECSGELLLLRAVYCPALLTNRPQQRR